MRRKNNLKLPNGFGSIVFLGSNRRKPYGARITTGYDDNGKQLYNYVGYGETYNETYKILCNYNDKPYDINYKNITVGEVYTSLKPIMFNNIGESGMSESNYKNLTSAYENYLKPIEKNKIIEVQKAKIQKIINDSKLKHTGRGYIKNIWQRLIGFANEEFGLKIDSDVYNLKIGKKEKSNMHQVIDSSSITLISDLARNGDDTAKMIMIYLYTGLRPSELIKIETSNVFLTENYMIGGCKTEAGKNRIIPIHSKVKDYVEYFYNNANKYLITDRTTHKNITYDTYQNKYENVMMKLGLDYIPGDTRTTFATKCDEVGISQPIIKRLMGHSLNNDVTNNVYIRKTAQDLKNEIERIKY